MNIWKVLVLELKTNRRCLEGLGSITFPCGSFAALETITNSPLFDTASTLPRILGSIRVTVLALVSREMRPAAVPRYALSPAASTTKELGTAVAGREMAVPAAGGLLLVSIGIIEGLVPLGGGDELVA